MKRTFLLLGLLLGSATFGFAQVFDFTVINATGYTIESIYVAPANDTHWGDDVLGMDQLEDGHEVHIVFPSAYEKLLLKLNVDKYDLKVNFEDGDVHEYQDLLLETIHDVTLKLDKNGNGVATFH